jgi:hypothetical protein
MPTEFEIAFANARKQGVKTFNYGGKTYTTKYREEKVFDDILTEYPALGKIYNTNNTRISMADANRQALNKKYGGGGGIETWFPDDEGPKEFPHPSLGKYNFEFYDKNIFEDEKTMKAAVYLDMIHGMKNDPEWRKLRNEFNSNWKGRELERLKQKYVKESKKDESLADYFDRTVIDGYLRGGLNPLSDTELNNGKYFDEYAQIYRGQKKENGETVDIYSPKQREIIENMRKYLKSK